MVSSTSNNQRAKGPNQAFKLVYIVLNIVILLKVHSSVPHASAKTFSNKTSSLIKTHDSNDFLAKMGLDFLDRMKQNRVDNIEPMDFVLCGCLVLLGLELLSTIVLKLAGCK